MRGSFKVYSMTDYEGLRKAGALAAHILDYITPFIQEGVTTEELDDLCDAEIRKNHAVSATLGYNGYPKSSCISLNHVICHGIPSQKKLHKGDILNIDITVILDGWYGDTSRMYTVGKIPPKANELIDVTYNAMMMAIGIVKPGIHLGDIGDTIQNYVKQFKFSVVEDYGGHGIGRNFHEDPIVMHTGKKGTGPELVPGNVFTIEPMINIGSSRTRILSDGWTAVTADHSLSAQFEHTIGVTDVGCEIFTLSPQGLTKPPYENIK